MRRGGHQRIQAREGLGAVHLEAAVRLRLDHDHAGARHALVAPAQQALLQVSGQGGGSDVEAQVHRVRYLVDVLAARALRAHRGQLDLALRDDDDRHPESLDQYVLIGSPRWFSGNGWPALPPAAALRGSWIASVGRSPSMRGRSVARSLGLGVRSSGAWPCGRSWPRLARISLGEGTGSWFGFMSSAAAGSAAARQAISSMRVMVSSK